MLNIEHISVMVFTVCVNKDASVYTTTFPEFSVMGTTNVYMRFPVVCINAGSSDMRINTY